MTRACIVGWAHTRFGKSEAPDTTALMAEVAGPALAHAGVTADQLDGIFVGVWNNGFSRQDFQGALVAMGTPELAGVPFMRTENACAAMPCRRNKRAAPHSSAPRPTRPA